METFTHYRPVPSSAAEVGPGNLNKCYAEYFHNQAVTREQVVHYHSFPGASPEWVTQGRRQRAPE